MVFSDKIYSSLHNDEDFAVEKEEIIINEEEIKDLENQLILNYKLLRAKHEDLKRKKQDNPILESISDKYSQIDEAMKKEQKMLLKHLYILEDYIKKNKKGKKEILSIQKEIEKIKSITKI